MSKRKERPRELHGVITVWVATQNGNRGKFTAAMLM